MFRLGIRIRSVRTPTFNSIFLSISCMFKKVARKLALPDYVDFIFARKRAARQQRPNEIKAGYM